MSGETQAIDIRAIPELERLVEASRAAGKPLQLQRNGDHVATLVPAPPARPARARRRLSEQYPDVDALVGAAGSLPEPRTWEETRAIIAEERAAAYRNRQR